MTTSPEVLRESVERLTARADAWSLNEDSARLSVRLGDLRTLLSALQEAREALDDIDSGYLVNHTSKWVRARVSRALSPGGAE